jgi:Flp pilus assembly protein TadG
VRRGRVKGQALVELAITLPLFVMVVFMTIELALLFVAYYSETSMARESARWLAVHSNTTVDDDLAAHVQLTMLPGLVNSTTHVTTSGTTSVDAVATVGAMTVRYTPCVSNQTVCTHNNRVAGATLYVEMSYDVSNLIFLPTTFRFGSLETNVPTSLPAYRVYVMVE